MSPEYGLYQITSTGGISPLGQGKFVLYDGRRRFIACRRLRTARAGNVGISTTSPQGTLDVNGSIYQRGSSLHADYVFESDYQLESIEDHAEYMWKNKHLKGIPEIEVDKNGQEVIEVGAHRKGIVEELEKAHIYIDQLHKKNAALEKRLAKLEALLNAR